MKPIKDVRTLGIPKMLLLGFQHFLSMAGATLLVPLLVNSYFGEEVLPIQSVLFTAGAGTLLFHLITKFKVPAYLGSSFAFLGGYAVIANLNTGIYEGMPAVEKMKYASGGVVCAGLFYVLMAGIVKLVGKEKISKILPPRVTGPVVMCIGLSLAASAVTNFKSFWPLGIATAVTLLLFMNAGKGFLQLIPVLMAVVITFPIAFILTKLGVQTADSGMIMDMSNASNAAIIGLPPFITAIFHGETLVKFDITAIMIMMPISLATISEHIADISAISVTTGEDFVKEPGLVRTIIGDGLATAMAGVFGSCPNTTYGENTSTMEFSNVHDPLCMRIAAVMAIILSFSPKFAAIVGSIPSAIVGGISIPLYGMITAIGIRTISESNVDLRQKKNLSILALILVVGIGFVDGVSFTIGQVDIALTGLALAVIIGIVGNLIIKEKTVKADES